MLISEILASRMDEFEVRVRDLLADCIQKLSVWKILLEDYRLLDLEMKISWQKCEEIIEMNN